MIALCWERAVGIWAAVHTGGDRPSRRAGPRPPSHDGSRSKARIDNNVSIIRCWGINIILILYSTRTLLIRLMLYVSYTAEREVYRYNERAVSPATPLPGSRTSRRAEIHVRTSRRAILVSDVCRAVCAGLWCIPEGIICCFISNCYCCYDTVCCIIPGTSVGSGDIRLRRAGDVSLEHLPGGTFCTRY